MYAAAPTTFWDTASCRVYDGLIDVVFKAPTPEGEKWFVADYKSNRIDPYKVRRYPAAHFGLEYMRYEMEHHHYYVQYHLYSLALHRYLRHRLLATATTKTLAAPTTSLFAA